MIERDEAVWRERFIQINMTRIGGTLIAMLGLIVWYTNVFTPGGSLWVGCPLAIFGVIVSFAGPVWLSKRWKRQDGR
jgi:hypothetical protein